MKTHISVLILFVFAIFSSCKNDKGPGKEELLAGNSATGKSWHITEQYVAGDPIGVEACVADDTTTYLYNNIYDFNDGDSLCNSSDPRSYSGTWVIANSDTLKISVNGKITKYLILELSSDQLILGFEVFGLNARTTYEPL